MARRDYTLDDCAAYDYPAAINKVIEVTKKVSLVYRAEFKINAPGVFSGSRRLFEVPAFIRDGYII